MYLCLSCFQAAVEDCDLCQNMLFLRLNSDCVPLNTDKPYLYKVWSGTLQAMSRTQRQVLCRSDVVLQNEEIEQECDDR